MFNIIITYLKWNYYICDLVDIPLPATILTKINYNVEVFN